jgi:hypothetical protein
VKENRSKKTGQPELKKTDRSRKPELRDFSGTASAERPSRPLQKSTQFRLTGFS